ncbi:MAG: hypothetical protein WA484_05525 [Solirubrobacteraceae bacterium]
MLAVLDLFGTGPLHTSESDPLGSSDTPPIEYAYLDSLRAAAYLGELEGGLSTSIQQTNSVSQSLSATLPVGTAASVGGSQQTQKSSLTTITPQAADRFYTFLQLLRKPLEADYRHLSTCEHPWLGEINDQSSRKKIISELECLRSGKFVRIENAQLFLPPFAQALPRARSTNAFYGELPAPRLPFTSPTQSAKITKALHRYIELVGSNPRMPFVAAPYGNAQKIGDKKQGGGIPIFLPALYRGLTLEPSLLSGSVTIVGEVVYYANHGPSYIDYPTVSKFGRALLQAKSARNALGVCSVKPPPGTRPYQSKRTAVAKAHTVTTRNPQPQGKKKKCASQQETLGGIQKSVTFKPPFMVVLPLAIYE